MDATNSKRRIGCPSIPGRKRAGARLRSWLVGSWLLTWPALGCVWSGQQVAKDTPPPETDSFVLRGDSLEAQAKSSEGVVGSMARARELYRKGEYAEAGDLYGRIADNKGASDAKMPFVDKLTGNSPKPPTNAAQIAEEARFYEAECLRLQQKYPSAADTYGRLLADFPSTAYREQALQHLFDISDYWLNDTRKRMKMSRENKDSWWSWVPTDVFHVDKTKPLFDEEGRAIEKLELVHYSDVSGGLGLGDKALFLAGSVKFFNEDYKNADYYFSQLHERHPNSPLAPQAVELAIMSKHLSTGGADYE